MDVKACDRCRKLNTEIKILQFREMRTVAPEEMGKEVAEARLHGFGVAVIDDSQARLTNPSQLCLNCLEKAIANSLIELRR